MIPSLSSPFPSPLPSPPTGSIFQTPSRWMLGGQQVNFGGVGRQRPQTSRPQHQMKLPALLIFQASFLISWTKSPGQSERYVSGTIPEGHVPKDQCPKECPKVQPASQLSLLFSPETEGSLISFLFV